MAYKDFLGDALKYANLLQKGTLLLKLQESLG